MSPDEKKLIEAERKVDRLRAEQEGDMKKTTEFLNRAQTNTSRSQEVSQELSDVRSQLSGLDCKKYPKACEPLQSEEQRLLREQKQLQEERTKLAGEVPETMDRMDYMAVRNRELREAEEERAFRAADNAYNQKLEEIRKNEGMAGAFDYYRTHPRPRREDFVADVEGKTWAFKMDKLSPEEADKIRKDPNLAAVARTIEQPEQTLTTDPDMPERHRLRLMTDQYAKRIEESSERPLTAQEQADYGKLVRYRILNDKRMMGKLTRQEEKDYFNLGQELGLEPI